MDNASSSSAARGNTNITHIGDNSQIDQYAQGENITLLFSIEN